MRTDPAERMWVRLLENLLFENAWTFGVRVEPHPSLSVSTGVGVSRWVLAEFCAVKLYPLDFNLQLFFGVCVVSLLHLSP